MSTSLQSPAQSQLYTNLHEKKDGLEKQISFLESNLAHWIELFNTQQQTIYAQKKEIEELKRRTPI
jgi:chaperonin cofactor prefoldin